jgi:hypothetical protein
MNGIENRLRAIGYHIDDDRADCWRVERTGPPSGCPDCDAPPAPSSRALALWLSLLRDPSRRPIYRVDRASASE